MLLVRGADDGHVKLVGGAELLEDEEDPLVQFIKKRGDLRRVA